MRAVWSHWNLIDRLAGDPAALAIAEVKTYAARQASMERRRWFATWLRWRIDHPGLGFAEQRPFTRMYRGEGTEPGRPQETFAVTGPEFG